MRKICKLTDCNEIVVNSKLELCNKHYKRWIRQWKWIKYPLKQDFILSRARKNKKEKNKKVKIRKPYPITDRQSLIFFIIIFGSKDRCYIWPYGHKKDKGSNYKSPKKMSYKGKMYNPPRLSLILSKGKAPNKERNECAHNPINCNNSLCVNPHHLRWATRQENMDDMRIAGTNPIGEKNSKSKLTEDDVRNILRDGRSQTRIAEDYEVTTATIHLIKKRKRWKHVTL